MSARRKSIPLAEAERPDVRRDRFLQLAGMFAPQRVLGFRKIRLGSASDGGYVMLDDFERVDLALSFGIDTNADWDLAVASRGIPVHQYDHSVSRSPVAHDLLAFERKRVVSARPGGSEVLIGSILTEARIARDASVILKCDIEGGEWPIFRDCAPQDLRRFSQIVIEFHDFARASDEAWWSTAISAISKLAADFGIFHVHGNNWRPMVALGDALFPDVLEVSFANRARYSLAPSNELFPTVLDQPNNPERPDHYLGDFQFGARKPARPGFLGRLQQAHHYWQFRRRQPRAG